MISKNKELLNIYLESFKSLININFKGEKEIKEIKLFSGIKLSSYYVPEILTYLEYPPYSDKRRTVELSWFVEIWIDGICIWRKSRSNEETNNLQMYEDELIEEMIRDIVICGLHSSWMAISSSLK